VELGDRNRSQITLGNEVQTERYLANSTSVDVAKNTVVCVCDFSYSHILSYRCGIIEDAGQVRWGNDTQYCSFGKYPSITLIPKGEKLYAVEIHDGKFFATCDYSIMEVIDLSLSKTDVISNRSKNSFSGIYPKIASTREGQVIVLYKSRLRSQIFYALGEFQTRGGVQIHWRLKGQPFPFPGKEFTVSISGDKALVVFREGFSTLKSVIGTVKRGIVEWERESQALPFIGYYPSVSTNQRGRAILCYNTSYNTINYVYGEMDGNVMIWMEETRNDSSGRYPSVALTDGCEFYDSRKVDVTGRHSTIRRRSILEPGVRRHLNPNGRNAEDNEPPNAEV